MPPNIGEIMVAEILGTGTLILLGDGVVAGVLLNRSKAQNSGWIVITMAWAFAVFCGVIVAGPISGAHLNPGGHLRPVPRRRAAGRSARVDHARVLGGGDDRCLHWRGHRLPPLLPALVADRGRRPQAGRLQHRPGDPQLPLEPGQRDHRHLRADVRHLHVRRERRGHGQPCRPRFSLGALPVALLVLVIGLALGGTTGYAINPARDLGPRIAHFLLPIPGKRDSDWAYSWVPVIGPLIGAGVAWVIYNFVVAELHGPDDHGG